MKLLSDRHLFWDTDIKSINPTVHKQAIIERVLERGSWANIKELISYYGNNQIIESSINARWFSDKTMYFVSGYFSIPLSDMRCYKQKLSNPPLYH